MMTTQSSAQLGVCSWSLQASSPQDLADRVAQTGVRKVQLALTEHRDDAGQFDGVQEALSAVGCEIVSGMFGTIGEDYSSPARIKETGGIVPDEHWEGNLDIAKRAAARAKQLGLTYVSMHAGFLPHEPSDPDFDKLTSRILTIAEHYAQDGLVLLFETGQESGETLTLFLKALEERGGTNVGVNFDPANMILYDMGDPVEALRQLMPWVRQVHMKDANRTTIPGNWGTEVVVGTGQVDWPAFMQVLSDADYSGDLIFEREAGDDRVADVRQGIANLGLPSA